MPLLLLHFATGCGGYRKGEGRIDEKKIERKEKDT